MNLPEPRRHPTPQAVVEEHLDALNGSDWQRLMAPAEAGRLAVAAAIVAAINEAAGVYIRDLPLTPERIWRARENLESGTWNLMRFT